MKTSTTTAAIAEAFAKARGDFGTPKKTKTAHIRPKDGSSYSYSYADLAAVLDAVKRPLADNGLVFTQDVITIEGGVSVTSHLMHASGEWIEWGPLALGAGSRAQDVGGAVSFARRYAASAALGIASDDDTDAGNADPTSPTAHRHGSTEHDHAGGGAPHSHAEPGTEAKPVTKADRLVDVSSAPAESHDPETGEVLVACPSCVAITGDVNPECTTCGGDGLVPASWVSEGPIDEEPDVEREEAPDWQALAVEHYGTERKALNAYTRATKSNAPRTFGELPVEEQERLAAGEYA